MKTYISIIVFISLNILSFEALAQYPVLKFERIHIPWDLDSASDHYFTQISVAEDGKLVVMEAHIDMRFPHYFFYNENQKNWSKIQLDDDKLGLGVYGMAYSLGLKNVLTYGSDEGGGDRPTRQGIKWILNYGDSVFLDTITTNYYHPYNPRPVDNDCVTPSVCYSSVQKYGQPKILTMEGNTYTDYDHYLYRRTNINGIIEEKTILALVGGSKSVPDSKQHYGNGLYYYAIDSETIVAPYIKSHFIPQDGSQGPMYHKEYHTLLSINSGETWKEIADTLIFAKKNSDNQWFLKLDPATYLYSSLRHGITPKKPVYYGFIDEHMENVEVHSQYGNGKKSYFCLCNNTKDSTEKNKFILYFIDNVGNIQKFSIPNDSFEYPSINVSDSSISVREIVYADDSILYFQVRTVKKGENNKNYYTAPQLYKIYQKEPINSVEEQPAVTSLQLYPNPTDHTLRWNTATGTAVITDALGRTLLEVPASAMEADVSVLATGMYFLTIRDGVGSSTRSFVVVR